MRRKKGNVRPGGIPMNENRSAPITEEEILEALRRVPTSRWGEVLQVLRDLEEGARLAAEFDPVHPLARRYTSRQLALLPREQRDAIYEASAAVAEEIYASGAMNEDAYGQSARPPADAR
jgi:hypothetical protein